MLHGRARPARAKGLMNFSDLAHSLCLYLSVVIVGSWVRGPLSFSFTISVAKIHGLPANELSFIFFNILPMGRFVSCTCKGETNL